jgi:hypothetical protein
MAKTEGTVTHLQSIDPRNIPLQPPIIRVYDMSEDWTVEIAHIRMITSVRFFSLPFIAGATCTVLAGGFLARFSNGSV